MNVPDDVNGILRARAAVAGMSLSDYIKADLEQRAAQPTLEEIDGRVTARGRSRLRTDTVLTSLREARDRD